MRLFFVLLLSLLVACSASHEKNDAVATDAEQPQKEPVIFDKISVEDGQALIERDNDLQVLDVRTPQEVAEGKIPGASEADIKGDHFEEQLDLLDKTKPVLVYCKMGSRSAKAVEVMKQKGFKEVYDLDGGFVAWSEAGLPVARE